MNLTPEDVTLLRETVEERIRVMEIAARLPFNPGDAATYADRLSRLRVLLPKLGGAPCPR